MEELKEMLFDLTAKSIVELEKRGEATLEQLELLELLQEEKSLRERHKISLDKLLKKIHSLDNEELV